MYSILLHRKLCSERHSYRPGEQGKCMTQPCIQRRSGYGVSYSKLLDSMSEDTGGRFILLWRYRYSTGQPFLIVHSNLSRITHKFPHIKRNILFFTLRFIATGLPSSNSNPAAPPSPDIPSSFSRSSSSNSAMVLRLGLTVASFGALVSPAGFCWLEMVDVSCDEDALNESTVCYRGEVGMSPYLSFQ